MNIKETESVLLLFIDFLMSTNSGSFRKEPFVFSNVYLQILVSSESCFKWLIFISLEHINTNLQGIYIPPHSCLQWRL